MTGPRDVGDLVDVWRGTPAPRDLTPSERSAVRVAVEREREHATRVLLVATPAAFLLGAWLTRRIADRRVRSSIRPTVILVTARKTR